MSNEQTDDRAVRLNEVKILPVFLSLFLPGLGQCVQKRFDTGAAFFVLHLFTSFIPYNIIICVSLYWDLCWGYDVPPATWIFASAFFACFVLTGFFAVLDTILWQLDGKSHFKKSYCALITLPIVFVLLLPPVSYAREAARRMQCTNNMKQLILAIHNYHDDYKHLPPAYTVDADGKPLHSWRVLLLPYLENQTLYQQIRLDEPWDSEHNKQFYSQMPSYFRCPSNRHFSIILVTGERKNFAGFDNGCHYSLVVGEETAFDGSHPVTFEDIKDGNGETAFLVERIAPVNWMEPDNDIPFAKACRGIDQNISGIGSMHPTGCNCGFADGRIRFLPNSISPERLKVMLTKSGGEKITLD